MSEADKIPDSILGLDVALPKLTDDGVDNNYAEWALRPESTLKAWGLWKFIEGDSSTPPALETQRISGTEKGQPRVIPIPGNKGEYNAVEDAEPWMSGNSLILSKIVFAVPDRLLYLVRPAEYAKKAWQNIKMLYPPINSLPVHK